MKYKRFLATKTHNSPQKINHFIVLLILPLAGLAAAPLRRAFLWIIVAIYFFIFGALLFYFLLYDILHENENEEKNSHCDLRPPGTQRSLEHDGCLDYAEDENPEECAENSPNAA